MIKLFVCKKSTYVPNKLFIINTARSGINVRSLNNNVRADETCSNHSIIEGVNVYPNEINQTIKRNGRKIITSVI